MSVMAQPEKRKVGRPAGRTPKYTIHTAIELSIGHALERYMASFEYEPLLKDVLENALKVLFKVKGFEWEEDTSAKKTRKSAES